ncbi:hypothetical protein ACFE04_025345 [Oxalis oulophora]
MSYNNNKDCYTVKAVEYECDSRDPLTLRTLEIVKLRYPTRRVCHDREMSLILDSTTEGYDWLLPGWICEERIMKGGRVYPLYYDPMGKMYKTKEAVDKADKPITKIDPNIYAFGEDVRIYFGYGFVDMCSNYFPAHKGNPEPIPDHKGNRRTFSS